jgi:NADH:ubiquinone oxidoreductase subunit C
LDISCIDGLKLKIDSRFTLFYLLLSLNLKYRVCIYSPLNFFEKCKSISSLFNSAL